MIELCDNPALLFICNVRIDHKYITYKINYNKLEKSL